jgi:hypothetical protein
VGARIRPTAPSDGGDALSDWRRDEATNQTRFRTINESIESMTDTLGAHEAHDVYVCECGDGDCSTPISLSRSEYEIVRSEATHFAIALNHENPEVDRVVAEHERYAVVQKAFAQAARIARESDPRQWTEPATGDRLLGGSTPRT